MAPENPPTDPNLQPQTDPGLRPPADTGGQPIDPEGQRAWLATLDRRLSTRTYIGAAAAVLALAAGIVAIVLALETRDNAASEGDVNRLERQLGLVAEDASGATEAQESIDSLSERVDSLEELIDGAASNEEQIQRRLDVAEGDIEDLRQEISDLESSGGADSGGGGG